jgi:activator of HSP90 ATPase
MAKTIEQTVTFRATPARLYGIYMDSKKHNGKVSIGRRVGGSFSGFGGALRGKILALAPNRMIVQSWRGSDWKKSDPDSILILTFAKARGGARLQLVHANVPDRHRAGCRRGWGKYYWQPWKQYLRKAR